MGTLILFAVFIGWGALVALADLFGPGAEGWARLLAAGLLVLHPIHEQRNGFRWAFNAAVKGWSRTAFVNPGSAGVGPGLEANVFRWREKPLGKRMNFLQATLLATAFPALALFGPWWALPGIAMFYVADFLYTHHHRAVPGGWSAALPPVALLVLAHIHEGPWLTAAWLGASIGSALAGLLLLAFPWWMAYRTVSRG